jgi:FAD/FMN-containing dehydrogenase
MTSIKTEGLAAAVKGQVLRAGDEGYDETRKVWNGRFDRRPSVIVRCREARDVVAAVGFAREQGLELAVKGGGHSNAGHSTVEGGLLIDLSLMKGVAVDVRAETARVEPGVKWREFDSVAQQHGLATTGGTVSSVGVAGFTLGGGSGYLVRKHGMAIDNLLSADVVTADGRVVRASADENPDLFWALRGGSGNFGIVTCFEFHLHHVGPQVLAGQVMHRFNGSGDLLRSYRDFMSSAPEDVQCYAFFLRVPPEEVFPRELHGQLALDFVVFHAATGPRAEATLEPLLDYGEPFFSVVAPQPYTTVQQTFDFGLPGGQFYGSRGHYLASLGDEVIDTVTSHLPGMCGAFTAAYFEPLGGAFARVEPSATAFPHRNAAFGFHIQSGWTDPGQEDEVTAWTEGFHQAMGRHATGGVYVNLLGHDEADRVSAAYGDNYARLVELKKKWDPDNFFRINPNIAPGNGSSRPARRAKPARRR